MIGTRLLHYDIQAHLGTGGMGEVYRALDTKLGRSVAIKVLPEVFAQDGERVARFEREARVLAGLNHPNIAALHGLEAADGRRLLVMELVEGETLAERIARGPVPLDEALTVARQICEALEAAHERGVVHRDLKPANVKVTPDGKVKVLDFGLAKAAEPATAGQSALNSPTISIAATHAGVILGTAAYMSPEQAKGLPADHRADIFSFGCVFYEMLSGRQSFQGDTLTEIIASVLKTDPDITQLPGRLNPRLVEVIRRCLAKDPKQRWHAVADIRVELEAIAADPRGSVSRDGGRPLWRRAVPAAAAAVAAAALTGAAAWSVRPVPASGLTRFSIQIPLDRPLTRTGRQNLAISPDGRQIVYVADNQLFLRAIDEVEARPIPGTQQDVNSPIFSPDGRWIAFYSTSDRKLKKVAVTGGAPLAIADANNPFGVSWGDDDTILIGSGSQGIMRVSANGGTAEVVVKAKADEVYYGPQMLPDGEHVLFTVTGVTGSQRWDQASLAVESLRTGERTTLLNGGSDGRYLPSGHLAYALGPDLLAVRFDARTRRIEGGPVPVLEGVMRSSPANTAAMFAAVSSTGTLAYFHGAQPDQLRRVFVWVDRAGKQTAIDIPQGAHQEPRVSPSGAWIVAVGNSDSGDSDLWVYDVAGGSAPRRLTFDGTAIDPVWTRDGERVIFVSRREGNRNAIFWQRADGSGVPERLAGPEAAQPLGDLSLSADGTLLLYRDERGGNDIWMLPLTGDRTPKPVVEGPENHYEASLSRDGRWIAYGMSSDKIQGAVFVEPFPPTGAKYQVTTTGTRAPRWSADGRRLYFLESDQGNNLRRLMGVDVRTQSGFAFGSPSALVGGIDNAGGNWPYDGAPGDRWLALVRAGAESAVTQNAEIRVTLNWFDELRRLVPAD